MTHRASKAPDWPERLRLHPATLADAVAAGRDYEPPPELTGMNSVALGEAGTERPATIARVEAPAETDLQGVARCIKAGIDARHAPTIALFLGHHKNGHHCAAELHVLGRDVVGGTVLCVSPYAERAARAWSDCATARLFHRREYTATEREANAREGKGMALEALAHGEALAIARAPTGTVATRLEVEGRKVLRFEVIAQGDRLNTTAEAFSWAERYLLPREKRR